jgi:ABC-type glycerol-3-phosphate transport system substrate-binding protein
MLGISGCSGKNASGSSPAAPAAVAAGNVWDGPKVDLTMMVFPATENYDTINKRFLEKFPEIAKKVNITVVLGGAGDGDIAQKMRLALASGEPMADLIRLNYTQLPEFAEADILENLNPYIAEYDRNIIEAAKQVLQYKGQYVAFPREIKPKVWFYRADIFEECGVNPRDVKTLDDYIAAGKKIQQKYPNAHMENYNPPVGNYDFMMRLAGNGGKFCDENGNYNIASDTKVKATFEEFKKFRESGVNSTLVEWSADWAPGFNSGELVSQLMGGWFKTDFMNFKLESQRKKWAIAPWPEEMREGSDAGGGIWVIPKAGKNKDTAAAYMAKLSFDNEAAKIVFDVTGIIPPLESAKTDPYFNGEHAYYVGSLGPVNFEAMEYLKVYPFTPASSQEVTIALQYLNEYLLGKLTVDEALRSAQEDMINQIGNPYRR